MSTRKSLRIKVGSRSAEFASPSATSSTTTTASGSSSTKDRNSGSFDINYPVLQRWEEKRRSGQDGDFLWRVQYPKHSGTPEEVRMKNQQLAALDAWTASARQGGRRRATPGYGREA